ncbi:MAG: SRPBCC domain-containing protein [Pseudomonadota bacterium]
MLYVVGIGLVVGLVLAIVVTPRVVEYVDTQVIKASARAIYDAIRRQEDLMRWSAWPSTTGSSCEVQNVDGDIGAQTVFFDKQGRRFGYQEVIRLEDARSVTFTLESKGPPHKPELTFYLVPINETETQVVLHFVNDIAPPFHLFLRLFGVVKWTRDMHLKDLDGLKRFCEPPYETFTGDPARRAVECAHVV